jgi:osmotically-inducible protein OsmY
MSGSEPRIPPGAPKEGGNNHSIQLRPRATSLEVKQKIEEALRRNAEMDAGKMVVEAHGGEVILHGSIHSRAAQGETHCMGGFRRAQSR